MMRRLARTGMGLIVAIALVAAGWLVLRPLNRPQSQTSATLEGLRSDANSDQFAHALTPRQFTFPQDHGPHNDFQTEWWYYTGNLTDASGRHFGYQLTLFRRALVPPGQQPSVAGRSTSFAFTQLYFGHFAVTDTSANQHVSFEKFSRSADGLAGAQAQPFNVFLEDWSARAPGTLSADNVQLKAERDGYAIALDLNNTKPIVLEGDHGLSQKSPVRGNASYYYSMTRMATKGKVTTPQGTFDVTGESWLDREWSTSALDDNTAGWDWFSLQLSDNVEIMFYQLRQKDGTSAIVSQGTYVDAQGKTQVIAKDDVKIDVLDRWVSDAGVNYPMKWHMTIPKQGLDLTITPRIKDQVMKLSQPYWEGAVSIGGSFTGKPITGEGYVELTGYTSESPTTTH